MIKPLYFGTSTVRLSQIMAEGLWASHLVCSKRQAECMARQTVGETGGKPVVLKLRTDIPPLTEVSAEADSEGCSGRRISSRELLICTQTILDTAPGKEPDSEPDTEPDTEQDRNGVLKASTTLREGGKAMK